MRSTNTLRCAVCASKQTTPQACCRVGERSEGKRKKRGAESWTTGSEVFLGGVLASSGSFRDAGEGFPLLVAIPQHPQTNRYSGATPRGRKGPSSRTTSFAASRKLIWQGLRDSNPRPSVLETDALPTELNPLNQIARWVFGFSALCKLNLLRKYGSEPFDLFQQHPRQFIQMRSACIDLCHHKLLIQKQNHQKHWQHQNML